MLWRVRCCSPRCLEDLILLQYGLRSSGERNYDNRGLVSQTVMKIVQLEKKTSLFTLHLYLIKIKLDVMVQ